MKLVKESISFTRHEEAKDSIGVGRPFLIKRWLDKMGIENYKINDDYSIDVNNGIELGGKLKEEQELPDYIQFGYVKGAFDISNNSLITLKGCPKIVKYGFYCYNNLLTNLQYSPIEVGGVYQCYNNINKFRIEDILKICKCNKNKIYANS